ncbi:MAG: hypothetical protein LL056_08380 [Bifidobacterium breve]|uniref:hypothetical protein n=1 Tax=Bifidobacterium breve TaxID=1685 RepID=UPI001B3C72DC|nr:hypothetical protein [Bifidobacterium breve]MCC4092255.1 hypothetical protein [Bifidobacterium breve]MCC4093270.1 hypothetical protein [Bifidobacterium breve]MDB1188098.1 hypothetical protein [Bifidobacterium breve]
MPPRSCLANCRRRDFAHIAIMNVVDGASNEWLEPVEAEYDAPRCIDEAAKSM